MKTSESQVAAEARRAAEGQLSFYNRMMGQTGQSNSKPANGSQQGTAAPKKK